jgi:hypothetical protein
VRLACASEQPIQRLFTGRRLVFHLGQQAGKFKAITAGNRVQVYHLTPRNSDG